MASYEGRFVDCAASEFPAVTNYDYRENLPIRGSNDRSFRWEDVSKKSVYLYEEVTSGGSFEENLYTTYHTISNHTGINYITSQSNVIDLTGYPGWIITGGFTVWIGESGIRAAQSSLSGLTSSFTAHPIEGDESIGLYSWTGYNSMPAIISQTSPTGEGGIIPNGTHQVYLQARTAYTTRSTEYLNVYVRGWNSNTVVAYYHPFSGTWNLSAPSLTGYPVSTTGYTEIKYTFVASDFPAATPTGYDVVVTPTYTGGFIVVDDVHIDARLRANAFVDHLFPTGYMIEITPDIGAHNVLDMFSEQNPYLSLMGPFKVELGNLEDNLDNTVTATVDSSVWDDAINSRYHKYLWRVLPLEADGNIGRGSIPNRFNYIGDTLDRYFSVTSVSDTTDPNTKVITGTKSARAYITVDGSTDIPSLVYPTDTTWKLVYILNQAKRTIAIRAVDPGGATSSVKYIELENKIFEQNYQALWNTLDEHGLMMDIERLPYESNKDYADRIKDVSRNKGGPTFVGIVNGGIRELGLKKRSTAISLSIYSDISGPLVDSMIVEVASTSFKVHTESMLMDETLYVDPVYGTVELSKEIYEYPIFCEIDNGKPVDLTKIVYHADNEEYPTATTKLYISDYDAHGKHIQIRYAYYEVLDFSTYPTIGSLVTAINQMRDVTNNRLLIAYLDDELSGNESVLGLYLSSATLGRTSEVALAWSPMYLRRVSDRKYREYLRGNLPYRRSKFYDYVSRLKLNSRTLWGYVEADRDYWDSADREDLSFDTIPTIMDPPLSEFYSIKTGESSRVESVQAWGRRYLGYNGEYMANLGLVQTQFQPGIGHGDDLEPDIYYLNNETTRPQEQYVNISRTRLNNEVVVFSGQR